MSEYAEDQIETAESAPVEAAPEAPESTPEPAAAPEPDLPSRPAWLDDSLTPEPAAVTRAPEPAQPNFPSYREPTRQERTLGHLDVAELAADPASAIDGRVQYYLEQERQQRDQHLSRVEQQLQADRSRRAAEAAVKAERRLEKLYREDFRKDQSWVKYPDVRNAVDRAAKRNFEMAMQRAIAEGDADALEEIGSDRWKTHMIVSARMEAGLDPFTGEPARPLSPGRGATESRSGSAGEEAGPIDLGFGPVSKDELRVLEQRWGITADEIRKAQKKDRDYKRKWGIT